MKYLSRVLAAIYIFILSYFILSFFFSETGFFAKKELEAYKTEISANIDELKKINNDFLKKLKILNTSEKMKLAAKEMGYLEENEKKIFLEGLERQDIYHSIGSIIHRQENQPKKNNQFIRSISFIAALLFYIVLAILLPVKNGLKKIREHNRNYFEPSTERQYRNNPV